MDKLQKLKQELYDIAIKTYSSNSFDNEMAKWNLIGIVLDDAIVEYSLNSTITLEAKDHDLHKKYHKDNIARKLAEAVMQNKNITTELVPIDTYYHLDPQWHLYEERSTSKLWVLK